MATTFIRKWASCCIFLGVFFSPQAMALTEAQIKKSRLIAGELIRQKEYEKAGNILEELSKYDDAPSMHLRALLILQLRLSGNASEALSLLCQASGLGYSKSTLAIEKLKRSCDALPNDRVSQQENESSVSPRVQRTRSFAADWLKVAPSGGYYVLGNGSGVAISAQGSFITNHHVVEDCERPVIVYQGLKGSARVIYANESLDVAFLQVDAPSPFFVRFDSRPYELGETLYAAGYPLSDRMGDDLKLTKGMLMSARDDERGWIPKGFLLTDIPVGSGNSGGPIFSEGGLLRGLVAGIWFWSEEIPEELGQMSDNPTAAVSGLEIIKYLDSRQSGLYTVYTDNKNTLKSTEVAKLAEKVTVKVECIGYD